MKKFVALKECNICGDLIRRGTCWNRVSCDDKQHINILHRKCFHRKLSCYCGKRITHFGKWESELKPNYIKSLVTKSRMKKLASCIFNCIANNKLIDLDSFVAIMKDQRKVYVGSLSNHVRNFNWCGSCDKFDIGSVGTSSHKIDPDVCQIRFRENIQQIMIIKKDLFKKNK